MLPNGVSRASPVLIAVMQLFAHVYLLIKTRREAANNRSRRFISMMSMWNGTLLIMVMRLFYLVIKWIQVRKQTKTKPHDLISLLAQYRATVENSDVWSKLCANWDHFFWLTGETPDTLQILINRLSNRINLTRRRGRLSCMSIQNQFLLTFMWLRRYPTMQHLAVHFGISVGLVHKIIHRYIYLLHAYIVPKYIRWHSMPHWRRLAGESPDWPTVVAILDCTPMRISKPTGVIQGLFYRGDRHCHFLNYLVIIDIKGYVCYSRPGFVGHLNDTTCYDNVNIPVLPAGLRIMADQGFTNRFPLLLPVRANGQDLPKNLRRSFRRVRGLIERCFGCLKTSYVSVGTRRFRSRRWIAPIICNLTAGLYNRCRLIFQNMRNYFDTD